MKSIFIFCTLISILLVGCNSSKYELLAKVDHVHPGDYQGELFQFSNSGEPEILLEIESQNSDNTFSYSVYNLATQSVEKKRDSMDTFPKEKQMLIFKNKYEIVYDFTLAPHTPKRLTDRNSKEVIWSINDIFYISWQNSPNASKIATINYYFNSKEVKSQLLDLKTANVDDSFSIEKNGMLIGLPNPYITPTPPKYIYSDNFEYLVFIRDGVFKDFHKDHVYAHVYHKNQSNNNYEYIYDIVVPEITRIDVCLISHLKAVGNTIIVIYEGGRGVAPEGVMIYDLENREMLFRKNYWFAYPYDVTISADKKYIVSQAGDTLEIYSREICNE